MDVYRQVMEQAAWDNAFARENRLTDAERNAKHLALIEMALTPDERYQSGWAISERTGYDYV